MTDTATPFRWGILGVARINRSLVGPLASNGHQLLAVASRSLARAKTYADVQGIPRAYGSYEELLADPEIDAVYIPLPHSLHVEWAVKAAEAGKHVLVEKPVALEGAGVRTLQSAARTHDVVITEAFMYRHHPIVAKARELTHDGTIGRLQGVRGTFSFALDRPGDTRLDPEYGGGSLWDVGCYPVSFARTIVGVRPVSVQAAANWSPAKVDLSCFAQILFPDDVVAHVHSSFESPFKTEMEIIGSEGRLLIRRPFKPETSETIEVMTAKGTTTVTVEGPALYQGEVDDVRAAAREGRPPLVTLDESLDNIETLVAILKAARNGNTVDV
ncbi:oxidoreductase [Luteitalea sp. TBR-22]|uniref:Gfo/Idh/MocA family protein n=1 Tax=Luteitalea sp. TBR-22 TaxID=2802971 RepID=UPI001AFAFDD0|nr:Gfo/Idh/MocA family oxidoreductase [Luteitalea sp. TBR-22]BCS34445.1 oxidoreductase [Luteitalea sp. TBR-22]